MDIEFVDSSVMPRNPEEVQILAVQANLLSDQRRIQLTIEITPFLDPPDLEIEAFTEDDKLVASTAIIGVPNQRATLILHLRGEIREGRYRVQCTLKYAELDIRSTAESFVTVMHSPTSTT
jgi:hypothetical protein